VTSASFLGFAPEAMDFLRELKANNDRGWFASSKPRYERVIRRPAEAFAAVVAPEIEALAGCAVTTKIFRIHRDVRFSKDKSPYNAHLHIGFVTGASGFYFGLEPDCLHLGAGAFEFSGLALDRFRAAAANEAEGVTLAALVASLRGAEFQIGEPDLKRVPTPYPADHPRGDLLRRKGLTAWRRISDRATLEGLEPVDEALNVYRTLTPLNQWIGAAIV
jgi:uncharacterized protein (TIGR02453 family)